MAPHRFEHENRSNLISDERRRFQPAEDIIDRANVAADEKVADLGCGNGYLSLPLADRAGRTIAIDAQAEMLSALMERASTDEKNRLRPIVGELPSIPLKDGCLDRVFLVNILHEIGDKERTVSEISRVLRKGGMVTFVDFQKKETKMGPPLHERIPEDSVLGIFTGFELVHRFSFDAFYQFELTKR